MAANAKRVTMAIGELRGITCKKEKQPWKRSLKW